MDEPFLCAIIIDSEEYPGISKAGSGELRDEVNFWGTLLSKWNTVALNWKKIWAIPQTERDFQADH
jgi:hypothetical protein